ncbi:hypothetical protein MXB_4899, partial [Myxobolus squamalis]
QISNLRKLQKNLTVEKISKNYRKNKENGKEAIDNLFNQLNLKCKQKNIQGEVARFGSPNTVYFGGSLNYSTYFRFDDIQILSETLQTNKFAADSCFLCGTIVDKLIENIEDLLKRDRKFDYDHHCKNVSYRLQEIDYFKPKRIQIFRALSGPITITINYEKVRSRGMSLSYSFFNLRGIFTFLFIFMHENVLNSFKKSSNSLKYYFFCQDLFCACSLTDFILKTGNGINIILKDITDYSIIDDKFVFHYISPTGNILLKGVNWCLLFKISNKNDPDSFKSNEIVIQMQGESNNSNDDDNSDSECADFVPPDICCEVILQESIGSSNNDENQAIITAIEINVSGIK